MADKFISQIHIGTYDYKVKDADARTLIASLDSTKAPKASPAFTGTPTAPTAAVSATESDQLATTLYVKNKINDMMAAAQAMVYKGTIGTGSDNTWVAPAHTGGGYFLPDSGDVSGLKIGDTYIITTAGKYYEHDWSGLQSEPEYTCEQGDMVIKYSNDDHNYWTVIQKNIDGAVTGPTSSTINHVAIFSGDTGKVIKDSGFTIAKSVPSSAVFTDTKVTSVTNHYTPTGTTTKSASGASGTSGSTVQVVTGVTVDAAGHVTAVVSGAATDTVYTHPTSDGSKHVPATGTTSDGKVLVAGSTAGSFSWKSLADAGISTLQIGTTATTAAAGNHTHTTSIATSSGTSQLTLNPATKYSITAGGTSYIFTTPSTATAGSGLSKSSNTINHADSITAQTIAPTNDSVDKYKVNLPTITVNGTGHATAVSSKVAKVELNHVDSSGDINGRTYATVSPSGTVSQPTFSGTAKKFAFSGTAATIKPTVTATGSFTGTAKKFAFSGTSKKLAFSGTAATINSSYTPSGSVSLFVPSDLSEGLSYTPAGTVSVTGASYTPAGSVSITPSSSSTLTSVNTAGTVPSWSATVDDSTETLSFSFSAGAMPTFNSANRLTSVSATFSGTAATISPTATFSGTQTAFKADFTGTAGTATASYTPAGTINVNASSGSGTTYTPEGSIQINASSGSGTSYTPEGSVSVSTSVTGASYTPAGTIAINDASGSGTSYTPAGTVSQPTFTGDDEFIVAEFSVAAS